MPVRAVQALIDAMPATDGAGVELRRAIGQPALMQIDPFLLLDSFCSERAEDYIAGFPPHPHRGFETVTYLLQGRMRHRDSLGHEGVIEAGGVQWMTAGRGLVHSEMPEQRDGLLQGFQLWINLPAAQKMSEPSYQEFPAAEIPVEDRPGARIRVIAGTTRNGLSGPVSQPLTDPLYLDVELQPDVEFEEGIPASHHAFLYGIHGSLSISGGPGPMTRDQLALLAPGDRLLARSGREGARFLLIAGRPIGEPVARGGPFVMNSDEEIHQAFEDYREGRLGQV